MDSSDQNVFQMYVSNGEKPGFWLRRTTWGNTIAQVTSVGPFTKPGPYYGNPEVLADIYSLSGELRERGAKLPVLGTYKTWRLAEAPAWAKPLADRDNNGA